jgi:hypothetical protein
MKPAMLTGSFALPNGGVGELELGEVVDVHARPQGHREHVDPLVDTVATHRLRAEEATVESERDGEVDRLRTGVVAGVVAGVQVEGAVLDTDGSEAP